MSIENQNHFLEFPQEKKPELLFLIIFLSIFLIFGIGFWKNKNKKKSSENLENHQNELLSVKIEKISPQETYKKVRNDEFLILDLRNSEEFETAHIEASSNLPINSIEENPALLKKLDKKKKIILVEKEETEKAKIIASQLIKNGYQIRYLEGGINNYLKEGFPLVSIGSPLLISDRVKVTSLSALQIKEKIKNEGIFILLDVRPSSSFQKDSIPKSFNIPLEELEKRKNEVPIGKIIVFDDDISRSFKAAVRLYDMNILEVYNCLDDYQTLKQNILNQAK